MYKTTMFLYQTPALYSLDKMAVELDGLLEIELMQRAGTRVWQVIKARWSRQLKAITVFVGCGNNGGDGFVVALQAIAAGLAVQLISHGDLTGQSSTSAHFRQLWLEAGGTIEAWQHQAIQGQVIVDGLLGIGLSRALDESYIKLINTINQTKVHTVSIDIPSGLNADTGMAQPVALMADVTITFFAHKTGQFLGDGPDICGDIIVDELGVSASTLAKAFPALVVIDEGNIRLPVRRLRNSHKGLFGHVLVIGGDKGMSGAALLTAQTALRAGAGIVSVLVHPDCVHALSTTPELMVKSWREIDSCIDSATVIVVGPGLGQGKEAANCLQYLSGLSTDIPMVVDASALSAEFLDSLSSSQIVITPHPGEAAGLLAISIKGIQSNRLAANQKLVERFGVVSLLKGSGSLIQRPGSLQLDTDTMPGINVRGHPGMATAGMGDVLAGLIAGLIGQGLALFDATKAGVLIHALCAENYLHDNDEISLIATDIIDQLPKVIKQLRQYSA
jgi:NAD(P)H-hydrate epimerase